MSTEQEWWNEQATKNGGPAFPFSLGNPETGRCHFFGLTKREVFAALAMNGILANSGGDQPPSKLVATLAYDYADAMLALPEPPKGET